MNELLRLVSRATSVVEPNCGGTGTDLCSLVFAVRMSVGVTLSTLIIISFSPIGPRDVISGDPNMSDFLSVYFYLIRICATALPTPGKYPYTIISSPGVLISVFYCL